MDSALEPREVPADSFLYPVECALSLATDSLVIPAGLSTFVRDRDGELIESLTNTGSTSHDSASYVIEFGSRVKLYFEFTGAFEAEVTPNSTSFEFRGDGQIKIGARSSHERPAHTVVTTDDPAELIQAISTFGSALKTTSPERSFPTLRGHPPALEFGNTLDIPDDITVPSTGITIETPATFQSVLPLAPLAYYLGASVVQGPAVALTTDDGWSYPLTDGTSVVSEAQRVLKQVFFLDCITRTAGLYQIDLRERSELEERISISPEHLYDQSPAERLRSYLAYDFSELEDLIPRWPAHARVQSDSFSIEYLPYLVNDLVTISTGNSERHSTKTPLLDGDDADDVIGDVTEQIWVGDGFPPRHTKAILEGYEHNLGISGTDGNIRVAVVLNDATLDMEAIEVNEIYGKGTSFKFDVSLYRNLDSDALRALLQEDIDFLHFIGHVTKEGIKCSDGVLDAGTISDNGITYFLLNACSSAKQGCELVRGGSVGGIVTLTDVTDTSAGWFGVNLAKLLNAGYPLKAALTVLEPSSIISENYQVVGTNTAAVATKDQLPHLLEVETDTHPFELTHTTFHTDRVGVGGIGVPYIGENETYMLVPTSLSWQAEKEKLLEFCDLEWFPVRIDGELFWSDEIDEQVLDGRLQPAD